MRVLPDGTKTKQLHHHFEAVLADAFASAGFQVSPGDGACDLLASGPGDFDVLIELKTVRDARRVEIEEKLAAGTIQLLQLTKQRLRERGRPTVALIVVGAPVATDNLWTWVETYGETWLTPLGEQLGLPLAYGLADTMGFLRVAGAASAKLPNLAIDARPELADLTRPPTTTQVDIFSDLSQWQLKVLLGQYFPPALMPHPDTWVAPGGWRLKTAADLANIAQVSRANSYKLINALKEQHFLADDHGLRLVRWRDLLQQWAPHGSQTRSSVAAVPLFPIPLDGSALDDLVHRYQASRPQSTSGVQNPVAIAGAAAAERLGYGHVRGVVPSLYSGATNDATLLQMGLRRARPGEKPQVIVHRPKYPKAVFKAAVARHGVPVTDIIQTWMDVQHEARGQEQATILMEHAIAPMLESNA